jgi:hypothetical protein
MLRSCKSMPYCWLMSWPTAARLNRQKIHLELTGSVLDDQTLDGLLLGLAEHPAIAFAAASASWTNFRLAASYKEVNRAANAGVAQPRHCHHGHDFDALLCKLTACLAPFMELFACLFGCVLFSHQTCSKKTAKVQTLLGRTSCFFYSRAWLSWQ